jgi:hypothetical protein
MDNVAEMNFLTLENPELAALMYKAMQTSEDLTDLEEFRFGRAAFSRFRHGDMAYFHYQRGAIR